MPSAADKAYQNKVEHSPIFGKAIIHEPRQEKMNRAPSRRGVLKASAAALATSLLPTGAIFALAALNRTQDQILGPFYPVMSKPDRSGDLTRVHGGSGRAKGQPLIVTGRVRSPAGKPVAGADIEIWQANAAGRYAHPDDTNPAPLDPDFQGFGAITTGADGYYRFKTIKPSAYPIMPTRMRPAHIHFNVRGSHDELITQMYFEGDPYNENDPFLQSAFDPGALIVKLDRPVAEEPDFMVAVFDIVFRG
ncbi:protocatechuate 3,4-dioxygenase [Nitrosovibrio tenuis]|uniref:Protocatechuate 3,4-dioxygenase, beta subunit n=1 Tax=Nitrosovibrio tenuis TaxID=1233 RepID=A0A1H7MDS1_9PROT|nr:protocatechuate 3,4-dioxygenase [Nitrosovibrio tenuis]SEL08865.1 protocatechuate 3,4-dioxygenase, beta subunit [Nitrosovibrio tenuis]